MAKYAIYAILSLVCAGPMVGCTGEDHPKAAESASHKEFKEETAKRGWIKVKAVTQEDYQRYWDKPGKSDEDKKVQE